MCAVTTRPEIESPARHGCAGAIYIGEDEFFGPELARTFRAAGYNVASFISAEHAAKALLASVGSRPSATARSIVVAFQPASADVRTLIRQCAGAIAHLILI